MASQRDPEHSYLLMAKIDNARYVLQLLRAVGFKDTATILGSENGLKVTVEEAKCVQANAFIQSDIFQEYEIKEEVVTFKVNLNILVECLNMFGGNTSPSSNNPVLKLCYAGVGFPLILLLEEGGVITDCSIKTYDADDTLDFEFCNTGVVNKVIMRSECLRDIFMELDMTSETLDIVMSPDLPHLRFSTEGSYGTCQTDIPKESDVIENFACTQTMKQRYKLSLLKPALKPLAVSQKVSVRMDNRGFLCLQFMVTLESSKICFVEVFCCPEEDDED